jgi:hypothetical protein
VAVWLKRDRAFVTGIGGGRGAWRGYGDAKDAPWWARAAAGAVEKTDSEGLHSHGRCRGVRCSGRRMRWRRGQTRLSRLCPSLPGVAHHLFADSVPVGRCPGAVRHGPQRPVRVSRCLVHGPERAVWVLKCLFRRPERDSAGRAGPVEMHVNGRLCGYSDHLPGTGACAAWN